MNSHQRRKEKRTSLKYALTHPRGYKIKHSNVTKEHLNEFMEAMKKQPYFIGNPEFNDEDINLECITLAKYFNGRSPIPTALHPL